MKFRNALMAASMLALPVAAQAQPLTGLYVGGAAGVSIPQNEDVTARTFGTRGYTRSELQERVGPAASLYAGGSIFGLRVEVEGKYLYNTLHNSGAAVGGQEQKFGPFFNVLYDLTGVVPYVSPYIGAGVGYLFTQERNLHVGQYNAARSTVGNLAYQGILGAAMPVAAMPGLAVTADYRFVGTVDTRNYDATTTIGQPAVIRAGNQYNHTILIGLRYTFGQTPPPPPAPVATAVPPSPVSRSYLVFFDWDKATLTDRARQIVSEAAANSTKVQYTRIEVNGYTDTSGTARYNQGLSIRRAKSVAAELVKDGVPESAIAIQGFGETHLLVQTGPGVREPQNRRVEIIIK